MDEGFYWVFPEAYRRWLDSEARRRLLEYAMTPPNGLLPLPKGDIPTSLPFLHPAFHQHPAPMNPYLAAWIWQNFVDEGDVVVEPMVGVGGTVLTLPD